MMSQIARESIQGTLMNSPITLSWLGVFAIFFLGFAVGWVVAKARAGSSLNVDISTGSLPQGAKPGTIRLVKTTTTRTLAMKCKCGAFWQFSEGAGDALPGTRPMPTGDSFVCPNCGNSLDLKAERQLEAEVLAKLNLKNPQQ